MIEGLHFDVPYEELKEHLGFKARHHDERRVFYEKQVHVLDEGGAEAADFSGGDPIKALRSKASDHRSRSELFQFLTDHLIEGEVYRLSQTDLVTLELISRLRF